MADKGSNTLVCNVSLHNKIVARSGRLQLIVAAMTKLARSFEDPDTVDYAVDDLMKLAGDFGSSWLDDCANLLKEMYNRKAGP